MQECLPPGNSTLHNLKSYPSKQNLDPNKKKNFVGKFKSYPAFTP